MFGIKGMEWVILLVIVLLIFGPAKIPALAKSVGKAITEFRKGVKGVKDDMGNIETLPDEVKAEEVKIDEEGSK